MEEQTYPVNIRHTGKFQYEGTIPEIGVTKTAPTLDSALNITLHYIIKHLTTCYLILVFVDQHTDKDARSVGSKERPSTDLEHQVTLKVAQVEIAPQLKRRERHLVFELPCPLI